MSLVGIRVGMTYCRALVVSAEGEVLGHATQDYLRSDKPTTGGDLGLDPKDVWSAIGDLLLQMTRIAVSDPIRAICITSTGDVFVSVTSDGQLVGPCLVRGNDRGNQWVEQALERIGRPTFFEVTGDVPGAGSLLGELCWLREQENAAWQRVWRVLPLGTWITTMLGGRPLVDPSLAAATGLFDIGQMRWSGRIADACDIIRFKLPEVSQPGAPMGICSSGVARQFDLSPGVQLVLGGRDDACGALGCGVISSGAYLHLGSSLSLFPAFQAIPLHSLLLQNGLGMSPHVIPNVFLSAVEMGSGGRVLQWLRDLLLPVRPGSGSGPSYNVIERFLEEMPEEPTQLLSLPGFAPTKAPIPRMGHAGALLGLDASTGRGEVVKALLEGLMFGLADDMLLIQRAGISIPLLRCAGGGSRSPRWLQLVADVTGLPVERIAVADPAPLGAAMLAAVGVQLVQMTEAVQRFRRVSARYEPDVVRHRLYDERRAVFAQVSDALDQLGWYGRAAPGESTPLPMRKAS